MGDSSSSVRIQHKLRQRKRGRNPSDPHDSQHQADTAGEDLSQPSKRHKNSGHSSSSSLNRSLPFNNSFAEFATSLPRESGPSTTTNTYTESTGFQSLDTSSQVSSPLTSFTPPRGSTLSDSPPLSWPSPELSPFEYLVPSVAPTPRRGSPLSPVTCCLVSNSFIEDYGSEQFEGAQPSPTTGGNNWHRGRFPSSSLRAFSPSRYLHDSIPPAPPGTNLDASGTPLVDGSIARELERIAEESPNLCIMSENAPPAGASNGDVPGQPYYDKTRQHLKELLHKQRLLRHSLELQEAQIYKKETEYLEETPNGNIITGFEAYTKGTSSGMGGGRKRGNVVDGNRVFSKSSISYNANVESPMPSAQSTPIAAMAPTPLSTSFVKGDSGSNHATPTSASSANRTGAGQKKNKKINGEDSETDTKDTKKVRTNFGVTRK